MNLTKYVIIFMHVMCNMGVVAALEYENMMIIECFNTVEFYYSNPALTGKSKLYYSYQNHKFSTLKFNLNCSTNEGTYAIKIEAVNLMLPAKLKDYCMESNNTDHK